MSESDSTSQALSFPRLHPESRLDSDADLSGRATTFDPAAFVRYSLVGVSDVEPDRPVEIFGEQTGSPGRAGSLAATFAAATGWTLGFEASQVSEQGSVSALTGTIYIDDMCANWPDGVPTASREKCDLLAACIGQLFTQIQNPNLESNGLAAQDNDRSDSGNEPLRSASVEFLIDHVAGMFGNSGPELVEMELVEIEESKSGSEHELIEKDDRE